MFRNWPKLATTAATVAIGFWVNSSQAAETYAIESGHTYPNFTISHLGFSTMHGRFNQTDGSLVMDRDGFASSVDITIDASSIDTGHDKRDDHLRNEDYFNVAKYPTITYESSKVTFTGEKTATVEGELTLLGVSKPVTLTVDQINCGTHPFFQHYVCGFNATTEFKRSEFGMTKSLPLVGDLVTVRIEVEAIRQEPRKKPGRR